MPRSLAISTKPGLTSAELTSHAKRTVVSIVYWGDELSFETHLEP